MTESIKERRTNEKAIEEYLKNGGKITKCATGDSGLEEGDGNPWKRGPGRPKSK